jgi:hypothetical protein
MSLPLSRRLLLSVWLLAIAAGSRVWAADTVELLKNPVLTREQKGELVGAEFLNDLAALDRRTALKVLASHADPSAIMAVAQVKVNDRALSDEQRLPFLGALFNSRREVDPWVASMLFQRAVGRDRSRPLAPEVLAQLQAAGWTISQAEFDGFAARYGRARGAPPTPAVDFIADATANPPWTRTNGALLPELTRIPQAGIAAIAARCHAAVADASLPLRTRVIAGYLLVFNQMQQVQVSMKDGKPVTSAGPGASDDSDVGRWVLYNAFLERDYSEAMNMLGQALCFATKKPEDVAALLRRQGWDIQSCDLVVGEAVANRMRMEQAITTGQQIGISADGLPDLPATATPAAGTATGAAHSGDF